MMSPGLHISCEFALSFGVPMLLALRELWRLDKPRGGWREPPRPVEPKPLPDCLIPKLAPRRTRELELTLDSKVCFFEKSSKKLLTF